MDIEFFASRVVAFDRSNNPVVSTEQSWKLDLDPRARSLKLRHRHATLSYDLQRDVMALVQGGQREETAMAKTFGRIALTGLASGTLAQGKGLGGALMDLAIRLCRS